MVGYKKLLAGVLLGALASGALFSPGFGQGEFSISLGTGVTAEPGQTVGLEFILDSPDPVAGVDMLLKFDPSVLTYSSTELLSRFQYVSQDNPEPGRLRLVIRRHHPDSVDLPPLAPGTDTLGLIWLRATTRDLLMDVHSPVQFIEDVGTPFEDNRLVKSDSSFVIPPELSWFDGSVLVRHPLYGDVNDDGYANTVADAIFLVNYLAGVQQLTLRQRANADVNRDGFQAGMADFLELIRIVVEE
jgi:hypothetical protein